MKIAPTCEHFFGAELHKNSENVSAIQLQNEIHYCIQAHTYAPSLATHSGETSPLPHRHGPTDTPVHAKQIQRSKLFTVDDAYQAMIQSKNL